MTPTLFVAVDPGVSGAIAAVSSDGTAVVAQDTPVIVAATGGKTKGGNAKKKKQYNEHEMVRILQQLVDARTEGKYAIRAVVEDVHSMPKDSKPGCFTFGESKGIWRGMLAALHIPYELVSPSRWRPAMVGAGSDKAAAIVAAQRLFPDIDLSRKKDHNKAEALLMAEYLKRRTAGEATSVTATVGVPPKRTVLRRKQQSVFGL